MWHRKGQEPLAVLLREIARRFVPRSDKAVHPKRGGQHFGGSRARSHCWVSVLTAARSPL